MPLTQLLSSQFNGSLPQQKDHDIRQEIASITVRPIWALFPAITSDFGGKMAGNPWQPTQQTG